MNKGEWTNEEILKLIQTNREEKSKGKNYMKGIKQRWHMEFPWKKRRAQNLVDNLRPFENESLGPVAEKNID